jgi:dihydrofolate reductase
VVQQAVSSKLADQIQIQLIPILFGAGTRLFDHLGDRHIELEPMHTVEGEKALHLCFQIAG